MQYIPHALRFNMTLRKNLATSNWPDSNYLRQCRQVRYVAMYRLSTGQRNALNQFVHECSAHPGAALKLLGYFQHRSEMADADDLAGCNERSQAVKQCEAGCGSLPAFGVPQLNPIIGVEVDGFTESHTTGHLSLISEDVRSTLVSAPNRRCQRSSASPPRRAKTSLRVSAIATI